MDATTRPDRTREILQLGDPRLRWPSKPVEDACSAPTRVVLGRLHAALAEFRATHGFGRAMAAPQLGIRRRLVAFDLGRGPRALINPRLVSRDEATITLWDDCLCFPELLVRVRRARSISLEFEDERGHFQRWNDLPPAESELFQHELDHLDGVLAVDRAIDADSIVTRTEFERQRERLSAEASERLERGV